jgi:hypothetical protein
MEMIILFKFLHVFVSLFYDFAEGIEYFYFNFVMKKKIEKLITQKTCLFDLLQVFKNSTNQYLFLL